MMFGRAIGGRSVAMPRLGIQSREPRHRVDNPPLEVQAVEGTSGGGQVAPGLPTGYPVVRSARMRQTAEKRALLEGVLRSRYFAPHGEAFLATAEGKKTLADHLEGRLARDRSVVVPWMESTGSLQGKQIIEIGCGTGSSTVAIAEQGADVTAIDVDALGIDVARLRCSIECVKVALVEANAESYLRSAESACVDAVVFYASLEHMTIEERLLSLADAWRAIRPGGLLWVVETPNRLWYMDSHTSQLPFFNWLPDDLAIRYARFSPRPSVAKQLNSGEHNAGLILARRGRGVSFHEFELAIGPVSELTIASCLPEWQRGQRGVARFFRRWGARRAYRRFLSDQFPGIPPAFFEENLDIALRKAE